MLFYWNFGSSNFNTEKKKSLQSVLAYSPYSGGCVHLLSCLGLLAQSALKDSMALIFPSFDF